MKITSWSSMFVLVGGRVVCTECKASQALDDEDKVFPHAAMCCHDEKAAQYPSESLHDTLDMQRR
jgi:hypothetical protein